MRRGDPITFEIPSELTPAIAAILKSHGLTEDAKAMTESTSRYGADTTSLHVNPEWTLPMIGKMAVACGNKRSLSTAFKAYHGILSNPLAKVGKLNLLPMAMGKYLASNVIDGWIYKATKDDAHVAYVVDDIQYDSGDPRRGSPPYVTMRLKANKAEFSSDRDRSQKIHTDSITWTYDDIVKRTAAECLSAKGYLHETPELKKAYETNSDLFAKYHSLHNHQFSCNVLAIDTDPDWCSNGHIPLPHDTKMVNDEGILGRTLQLQCEAEFWRDQDVEVGFDTIPVHPYILFFDLERHQDCWVHVSNCKPYVYDKTLRDKLVLPEQHRDLIEILTTDMEVFMDDVIAGKSGGTAILCMGEPGLGKTLTAEVYSEVIERPLYRVHAGQLGVTMADIEASLEDILRRAERWGAILLLDEADVYIRKRDNDINHNAVAAAFLRTLEYFHGLMFLTTNRGDDIDDAIASRMIAMFKYERPNEHDAAAIWKILATQFGFKLTAATIKELVAAFPKATGRDIKMLLKLTSKYCRRKGVPVNVEAFRVCAMFRGVI